MSLIEFKNISKTFGDNQACRQISLNIEEGSIHSIIGENGAGKSTLVKLLGGLHSITSGQIFLRGENFKPKSAQDAYSHKIAFIHQHFVLADHLTVLENLVLSSSASLTILKNQPREIIRQKAETLLKKFKWSIRLDLKVSQISVGEQQRLEILKALLQEPDIIIFDEPTAVLTPQEADELLDFIINLKKQNKTILLISHKLREIKKVSDFVSVLRQGELVHSSSAHDLSIDQMAEKMIGEKKTSLTKGTVSTPTNCEPLMPITDTNITLQKNEIFGVAGIEGNGQSDLIAQLLLSFKKENLSFGDITEDRLRLSVFDDFSLAEHLFIRHPQYFLKNSFLQKNHLIEATKNLITQWDVRPGQTQQKLSELSGGNQQKFIVGRELFHNPQVLLAAHPTRGVDLGAQTKIHQAFFNFIESNKTVILISSELQEVLTLSDRFAILNKGTLWGPFHRQELSETEIGLYMTGAHPLQLAAQQGQT